MKSNLIKGSLALWLTLLTMTGAAAQTEEGSTSSQSAQQTPDKDDKDKQDDDAEPGKGKLSEFGEALAKFWSVSAAFQGGQAFDDNVFLANNFRKSDTVTKLSGRITVAYRGQHTRFEASYLPEFNLYQRYEPLNYSTHSYYQTLTHDFTRRLEMHWRVNASQSPSRGNLPFKTVNFGGFRFNQYSLDAVQDGLNLFHGSNTVGMSYRWTPRLKVTANVEGVATYYTVRGNPSISPISQEIVYSAGATVGLEYMLSARQTLGLTVGDTYFASVGPTRVIGTSEHQHYQSVRATYSHRLPNRFSLQASVGPGVTERPGGSGPEVGVFFDVGFTREMARYAYAASFQRTTQVGLQQGSITGYGATARAQRSFGRKWGTNIGASYLRSQGAGGLSQLETVSGNGQISYRISQRISPFINYGYTNQRALIPSPLLRNVTRNEVALGFIYNFGVIAGR